MASRLTSSPNGNWLNKADGEGPQVETWIHNTRWLEIGVYDYDAPKDRKWTITILDRETGARCTLHGESKFETRDAAMQQVGMPALNHGAVAA